MIRLHERIAEYLRGWQRLLTGQSPVGPSLPRRVRRYERLYERRTGLWYEGVRGRASTGSVELEVGRLWYALCMVLRPARVLETGTWRGYSTCCIAAALRDLGGERSVVTIDPTDRDHLWKGTSLSAWIDFRRALSQDQVSALAGREFDLLVLDSDHTYDTIIAEIIGFEPMLRVGGCMLLHDSLHFDGVGAAVRQLESSGRFELVTLDSPRNEGRGVRPPGVTIVRKKRAGAPLLFEVKYKGVEKGDAWETPLLRRDERTG